MAIAIVGAGMAGLSAATVLAAAGLDVRLFDKGRGAGGRMATRRVAVDGFKLSFDHGAQYFTARSPAFRAAVANWLASGQVARWGDEEYADGTIRYTGVPGMGHVIRSLAAPLDVAWNALVSQFEGGEQNWTLRFADDAAAGPFETVIVAVPAEQAAALLAGPAPDLSAKARTVSSLPCWAVMLAFAESTGIKVRSFAPEDGPLNWTARNSSKPGRDGPETWVLHARPEWSRTHLERSPDAVARVLTMAFREQTGAPEPFFADAHRWRYARVRDPLGTAFLYDRALGLATCGDWHLGARVEAAWTSGHLLANELLR